MSSSTANKVTIRETGPTSNDEYGVPVVVAASEAFGLVWQTPRGRMRTAPGMEPPGCPNRYCATWICSSRSELLQLTTPIRAVPTNPHPPG